MRSRVEGHRCRRVQQQGATVSSLLAVQRPSKRTTPGAGDSVVTLTVRRAGRCADAHSNPMAAPRGRAGSPEPQSAGAGAHWQQDLERHWRLIRGPRRHRAVGPHTPEAHCGRRGPRNPIVLRPTRRCGCLEDAERRRPKRWRWTCRATACHQRSRGGADRLPRVEVERGRRSIQPTDPERDRNPVPLQPKWPRGGSRSTRPLPRSGEGGID